MQERTLAGGSARFRGIAGSAITKVFDLYIGKTGLTKQEALKYGFDPIEEEIESITRVDIIQITSQYGWVRYVPTLKNS